jgi:RNA ligase
MNTETKFEGFKKIPRLSKEMVITEKLDGTNGLIQITADHELLIGSKSRWLEISATKNIDNYGFAKWALQNKEELLKLGVGKHFGEWVGLGIQKRNYNLTDKKFVLFDVHKWNKDNKPNCCEVVPVLYTGTFCTEKIKEVMNDLKINGSSFAKGFMNPEGIIIYHTASKQLYKKTFDFDETGKEETK